jgi:hypothetical protein
MDVLSGVEEKSGACINTCQLSRAPSTPGLLTKPDRIQLPTARSERSRMGGTMLFIASFPHPRPNIRGKDRADQTGAARQAFKGKR